MNMTYKEFLQLVVENKVDEVVMEKAKELLEQDIARLENQRVKAQEKFAELHEQILETLGDTPMGASDIAKAIDITPQKASAMLRQLYSMEKVVRQDNGRNKPFTYTKA